MGLIAGSGGRGDDVRSSDTRARFALRWGIMLALIFAAFVSTVVALNATLYSAPGFVSGYLDALSRRDATTALATPGVSVSDAGARTLLTDNALGALSGIRLRSDTGLAGGMRHLVYGVRLDGTATDVSFEVRPTSARLGLFASWEFVTSPTSTLEITPVSNASFEANGVAITSAMGAGVAVDYPVLTPAVFSIRHRSEYFVSTAQRVLVPTSGIAVRASVVPTATPAFAQLVQTELDATLLKCTEQTVLQPSGCPFGEVIDNRVEGAPIWSMSSYPKVTVVPGSAPGTWLVPEAKGTAHLTVGVQSLFDGTSSVFNRDVPFTVSYLIAVAANGSLQITAQ